MRKTVAALFILTGMACIAGCGGSSLATNSNITIYDVPAALALPYPAILGGAKQGAALVLAATAAVTTFAGSSAGFSDNIAATSAQFNRPIAITSDGVNLYVADNINNAIRQIVIASGVVTTIAGNPAGLAGSVDGIGGAASFNRPNGITTDGTNLYVTDSGNSTIRQIVISTGVVTTLAGGVGLAGSVDAVGVNARFITLNGITTDGVSLYVTDVNTIRRVVIAGGAVSTLAGAPGTTGSADGIQGAARFNLPARLTTDGLNLYVTDSGNSTIRRIVLATGAVTTIAGKVGVGGASGLHADSTDGTGFTARFNQPNGITSDGTNLYVIDSYDNMVRKIVLSPGTVYSGPVTTLANNGAAADTTTIGVTTDGTSLFATAFSPTALSHVIREIQ